MDTKSKILLVALLLLIVGSVGTAYYRYMVVRDYVVEMQTDCDPMSEACFIYVCDPEVEECSGNPEEDTWYYKMFRRNAANIPICDPSEEGCEAYVCAEEEQDCEVILCDETTLAEFDAGDACSDPEAYNLEHPEDGEEMEEGAEETEEATDLMSDESEEALTDSAGVPVSVPSAVTE
jgi:hypothetical protein